MSIALLVITDGRLDYLRRTIDSAQRHLRGPISEMWMYDDSGDPAHRAVLRQEFPDFIHFDHGPRQGFAGAVNHAWKIVSWMTEADHLFHLEGDFTFNRDIDLVAMREVLWDNPRLAQMALRRQAWGAVEAAAGGVVEMHPEQYTDMSDGQRNWLEHRLFYTTNPSLVSMQLVQCGWPIMPKSEAAFTAHLLNRGTPQVSGDQVRFGYWGRRTDAPWVHHIGDERHGSGY